MEKTDYIVIQLPEWDGWRIAGSGIDWQMQRLTTEKGVEKWKGTNFWPAIEYAVGAAYERTLRECGKEFKDMQSLVDECAKVKERLTKAVRKAVADA